MDALKAADVSGAVDVQQVTLDKALLSHGLNVHKLGPDVQAVGPLVLQAVLRIDKC